MKKSINNIFYGILGQILTIVIGLLLPRLRIVSFGSEVNGMLSSIQQIYTYLALLEAGVGSATLQALYGPVARNNRKEINEILAATNHYYKKTGVVYLVFVIIFAIFYPVVITSNIPTITIVEVILLNGLGNVLAYFFQGKYRILLQAEGKQYIITNLTTFVTVCSGLVKIFLINLQFDVVSLQIAFFAFNLLQVIFFAWYIKKNYKWINLKVKKNENAISQKNSVLVHQIAEMVFNNTDVLILTVFCGLKVVSVYALYNMVFDMVSTLIANINTGFSFKLGQLYNSNRKRFDKMYNCYERYYMAISFSLYCVAFSFIKPFIKLYTSGITDVEYLMRYLPILFTIIKLMVSGRALCGFLLSYAAQFRKTQNRAIIEAGLNLGVSIISVRFFGIYGVLLGTIVALFYRANDMIIYANLKLLKRNPWYTYRWWILNGIIFSLCSIIFSRLKIEIQSYQQFFCLVICYAVITISIFVGITYLFSKDITHQWIRTEWKLSSKSE